MPSRTSLASSGKPGRTVQTARARVGGWRQSQDAGPRFSASRPLTGGSWKTVSARFKPTPPPAGIRPSDLVVRVSAKPAGFNTYVYYNSGRELGIAPLSVRFDRPGRYRLDFWTPDIRGRASRWVTVNGRRPMRLAVVTGSTSQIARLR
jgi:hypothetical protein